MVGILLQRILVMYTRDRTFLFVRGTLIIGFGLFRYNISYEEETCLKLEIS